MTFAVLLILLTLFDIIAVISARYHVEKKRQAFRWISFLFFGLSVWIAMQMMEFRSTAIVNLLWVSLSTVFITITCYFLFGERINRWQGLGMILIMVGMAFL